MGGVSSHCPPPRSTLNLRRLDWFTLFLVKPRSEPDSSPATRMASVENRVAMVALANDIVNVMMVRVHGRID